MLAHASDSGEGSGDESSGQKSEQIQAAVSDAFDSVPALEQLWQTAVAEIHGGFVRSWTSKQRGQMKHFRKACPPGAALAVLEACLRDWPLFVNRAKTNAGAWDAPTRPDVGFLIRFTETAVNFWEAMTKSKVHVPPAPKPTPIPTQQIAKPSLGEEKASPEEVMAL